MVAEAEMHQDVDAEVEKQKGMGAGAVVEKKLTVSTEDDAATKDEPQEGKNGRTNRPTNRDGRPRKPKSHHVGSPTLRRMRLPCAIAGCPQAEEG